MKIGFVLMALVILSGCDMRLEVGEDLHRANDEEISAISKRIVYMKDRKGICYAVLDNHTADWRSTFIFSAVDCDKVGIE